MSGAVMVHSALLRCDQAASVFFRDDTTDHIHHATNIAFRGNHELFCANLGAWHITKIDLQTLR